MRKPASRGSRAPTALVSMGRAMERAPMDRPVLTEEDAEHPWIPGARRVSRLCDLCGLCEITALLQRPALRSWRSWREILLLRCYLCDLCGLCEITALLQRPALRSWRAWREMLRSMRRGRRGSPAASCFLAVPATPRRCPCRARPSRGGPSASQACPSSSRRDPRRASSPTPLARPCRLCWSARSRRSSA